jgi:peptide/nickel transport system substrate-binding protein
VPAEAGSAEVASDEVETVGPGAAPLDVFHPERDTPAKPLYGGRVIVHLASLPESICYPVENSAVTRRLLYEVHETLLLQDWEWHDYRPSMAKELVTEDLVVIADAARERHANSAGSIEVNVKRQGEIAEGQASQKLVRAFYGAVEDAGDAWRVSPSSSGSDLGESIEVPKADVDRIERGAVFTFTLRDDVLWHPSLVFEEEHPEAAARLAGHKVDAADVAFSWSIYSNPDVDCDEKRFQFEKITRGDVVDEHTVRFFYEEQYAFALHTLGLSLTVLPRHVYDLSDPDNPDHKASFTAEEQGKHINENPHNQLWVGTGPYRVTEWTQQYVQAERFRGPDGTCAYYDRDDAGFVDTIRWRYIDDDETAMNALLNGELDFFERIKSADYFGERTGGEDFTGAFYKGYKYLGIYGYTGWNMLQPQLRDLNVRKAIAMAMDYEEYRIANYKGLARRVTGPFPFDSAAYDHSVQPFPYDPEGAIDLLEDAEWYDRDGDGIRDKDGVALEIDFLMPSGNDASKNFGLKLQEALGEIEIKLNLVQMEWATFLEKLKSRQFDASNLAWVPELESDPEQLWHSKWGKPDVRGSNNSGVMDPVIDELIARGQRELDFDARQEIWREMHRYLYREVQPYLFMFNVPQKFALHQRFRGFQTVAIDPGYIIRRWHLWREGAEGSRATLDG